jgi:hypothetical protein
MLACACKGRSADVDRVDSGKAPEPDGPKPVMELDLSGDINTHLALRGTQVGRLEPTRFYKLTVSQSNDEPPDTMARATFSLQSMNDVKVGEPTHALGHLQIHNGLYVTNDCNLIISRLDAPRNQRWFEGTFSCDEMKTPKQTIHVANGHFLGRFVEVP